MRRTLLVVAVALLLVASFALPTALAQGKGKDKSQRDKDAWNQIAADKRARGLEKGENARLFAKCDYAPTGWLDSRFLRLHFDQPNGTIHSLMAKDGGRNMTFFSAISPSAYRAGEAPYTTGAVWHAPTANLSIRAHCNPTTLTSWANDANASLVLTFTLASNVTSGNVTGKEIRVDIAGGIHGHIMVNGNATLTKAANAVVATLGKGEKAMFRAHAANAQTTSTLHDQNSAFKDGKLGAVLHLVNADGAAVGDGEDGDVQTEVTSAAPGRVQVKASATVKGNRVFFLVLDNGTFDPAQIGKIQVKVTGMDAQKVRGYANVSTATGPAASVDAAGGQVVVMVNVPSFSDQTIAVEQEGASPTGGPTSPTDGTRGTPGFGGALGVLALLGAAVALLRRR